jgi:hypothetical protein
MDSYSCAAGLLCCCRGGCWGICMLCGWWEEGWRYEWMEDEKEKEKGIRFT